MQNTATRLLKYKIKAKTHFSRISIRLSAERLGYGVQRPTSKFLLLFFVLEERERERGREREREREREGGGEEEEKDDNFKIRAKIRRQQKIMMMMMMKNMVQIHDEQRSIQMTMLHRDTHKKHCSDKHCDYK